MIITQALVMAAGQATRMRPLTDNLPKPLLQVGDKTLLAHICDRLVAQGVTKIIVNGYHAIDKLDSYLDDIRPLYPHCDIILSTETILLETGGGAVQALKYLNPKEPFYMINGDAYWIDDVNQTSLSHLVQTWNDLTPSCRCLLLLQDVQDMPIGDALGDYDINANGRATRSMEKTGNYMFTGIRIVDPSVLQSYEAKRFSFLEIMDACDQAHTLYGLVHKGQWYHLSTPHDIDDVNIMIKGQAA